MSKSFIYVHEGKKYYDYCSGCKRKINQVEVDVGTFGCPHCKTDTSIEIFGVR